LAARSFAIREATRTPMPSLRPKRFGSMGEVYFGLAVRGRGAGGAFRGFASFGRSRLGLRVTWLIPISQTRDVGLQQVS
jgi:hypothetical protein